MEIVKHIAGKRAYRPYRRRACYAIQQGRRAVWPGMRIESNFLASNDCSIVHAPMSKCRQHT